MVDSLCPKKCHNKEPNRTKFDGRGRILYDNTKFSSRNSSGTGKSGIHKYT